MEVFGALLAHSADVVLVLIVMNAPAFAKQSCYLSYIEPSICST